MALTGKQARHLRALGHHLEPVVWIGKQGITEALIAQLDEAIAHHELVKVRLLPECPIERSEAGAELSQALSADVAQAIGRTLLFFRRNPQKPKVLLPNARGEIKEPAKKEASKGRRPNIGKKKAAAQKKQRKAALTNSKPKESGAARRPRERRPTRPSGAD